jgi:hypothetical protein
MTPLAHQIFKQLTLPLKHRDPGYVLHCRTRSDEIVKEQLFGCGYEIHCFECTEAIELAQELIGHALRDPDPMDGTLFFLPAPLTWLEWKHKDGQRVALMFVDIGYETPLSSWKGASVSAFCYGECGTWLGIVPMLDASRKNLSLPKHMALVDPFKDKRAAMCLDLLHDGRFFLPIINSPRIVGRRQHMPHRGLEKRLANAMGPGKFPLRAWTEIKLEIAKPIEIDDGEPHEAHITGRRALHFCRAHVRIKMGMLEYVRSHWRGDPAIGIRQSRYKLANSASH